MIEFSDIEREFEELEQNDEWEENFKFNYSSGDSSIENTLDNAKHSSNERYNRYRNILPYDHSRIKLKDCLHTDYINANLVVNKYIDKKYILTQGPLRNTCEHFWQMVWEQNTKGIVMLNRLFEKGMPKCEMYFPNLDEDNSEMTLTFGKFKLNYISEQPGIDFSIRVIECENLEQKEVREIYHFHFTNWPDFGEPKHTSSFLKFLSECKRRDIFNSDLYGPPIVHCSAGVGRSGTFILVDLMLEMFNNYDSKTPCSISKLLDELRSHRMGLVQTHTQYKYAFKAIIDGVNQAKYGEDVLDTEDIIVENVLNGNNDDESDESEDSDDEFYENSTKKIETTRRRPDTAMSMEKNKKFKVSKERRNRIKNLRSLQEKNRLNGKEDSSINDLAEASSGYETAKPNRNDLKLNLDFLNDENESKISNNNNITRTSSNNIENSSEEDSDSEKSEDDSGEEETPFATSRNIQTVKVNQPRKPLQQTLEEQSIKKDEESNKKQSVEDPTESGHIYQRKVSESTNLPSSEEAQKKTLSEKEKRIAEKVKEIKEKQKNHEKNQNIIKQMKPFLIGGGLLIGGLLIFEICKKNFFH